MKHRQWPFDPAVERYLSLASFRRNGQPVPTPVWLAEHNTRYYLFSETKAGKVKRIRANPAVRVAACNSRGKITSDWLDAHACVVTNDDLIAEVYAALRKKYGWQMAITDFFSKLSGRYHKRAIIGLEIVEAIDKQTSFTTLHNTRQRDPAPAGGC